MSKDQPPCRIARNIIRTNQGVLNLQQKKRRLKSHIISCSTCKKCIPPRLTNIEPARIYKKAKQIL